MTESGQSGLSPFVIHALREPLPGYFEHRDDDTPNFGLFKLICRIVNSNDLELQNASSLVLRLQQVMGGSRDVPEFMRCELQLAQRVLQF